MKRASILLLLAVTILSCTTFIKSTPHSASEYYSFLKEYEADHGISLGITQALVDSCFQVSETNPSRDECYYFNTLTSDILPNFGKRYRDMIPSCNHYFQEGNFCSQTRFQSFIYDRNPDGTMQWTGDNAEDADSIQWLINGDHVWTGSYLQFQPYVSNTCVGYVPECNGYKALTMRLWLDGVCYERSGNAFAYINNAPYPDCTTTAPYPTWHSTSDTTLYFQPFEFIVPETAAGDLTGDYQVNTRDLIKFLCNLCLK